jgi:hypothetical protein
MQWMWNVIKKTDPSNDKENWKHLGIIKNVPERHDGEAH